MKKLMLIVMSALFVVTLPSDAKETGDAKVYCTAEFIRLREGVNLYGSDREKPCFRNIPKKFEGRKITLRATMSTAPLEFEVKEAGIVTLVTDLNAKKLIEQGWVKVDEISFDGSHGLGTLYILQKKLDVGEYSIPSNGHHGIRLVK